MTEPNSQTEKPKENRRFSQEQYEMLLSCSKKKDVTDWNKWRKDNPEKEVQLDGAMLKCAHLKDVFLGTGLNSGFSGEIYLRDAKFSGANLEAADFAEAHLENARFVAANLKNSDFRYAHLQGTNFKNAIVDGATVFWHCELDRRTDFRGVSLDSARIAPGRKQLLQYNIRRMNWEEWYPRENRLLARLVRKFWQISDYGISTKRIIWTFFKWAFLFAAVYYIWGCIDYYFLDIKDHPGIVTNLFVLADRQEAVPCWLVPFRAVYFSIVTMTTLGFGDMYANAHSLVRGSFGHVLLGLQVILGYVLLGALITRFAVLFTAGGPVGEFADEEKEQILSEAKDRLG